MCTFENYKRQYTAIQERIVGTTTSNGILISGQRKHFIERVIGTMEDPGTKRPRSGVSVDDILDALQHPLKVQEPVTREDGKASQRFIGIQGIVSVNTQTGELIQCNPTDSDLVRRLMKNGTQKIQTDSQSG